MKKEIVRKILVRSFIIVALSVFIIPTIANNQYEYEILEFGLPFHFVEQTHDIPLSDDEFSYVNFI